MIQRIAVLLLLALGLAGCGDALDPDQVRACRQTLPAVSLDATSITVTHVAPAGPPGMIRIDYRTIEAGREHHHLVICGFGPSPEDRDGTELNRLSTEDRAYSPIGLHILKRYWLDRHEDSSLADPGPGDTQADVPEIASSLAYFMQSFCNGVPNTAITMLIAVAYALIYGLVGRINFTFGDFAALGSFATVSVLLFAAATSPTASVLVVLVGLCLAIGLAVFWGNVVERLVFAPLAFRRGQSVLIATVAVSLIMQEVMRMATRSRNPWAHPLLNDPIPLARAGEFIVDVTPMQILIGAMVPVLSLTVVGLMRRSDFGRRWRATADDPVMANLMGISSRAMLAQTFALATALAGLGGFIMTVYYGGADYSIGTMLGLKGLVAAVVGGIGSIEGALLGGFALGLFEVAWSAYLPIDYRDIAVMILLVATLVFRPGGLLGLAEARPRQV
ncbi:branched-chain amino acid ABC transporter permease [Labrys monachus]|uniref:Branched-subunit amino acid ABC-type transport system permease component n=1 Tax=Labrys monachus TaxID=217067 RepID=A0ABU0FKH8_9HYPH|nr:branched-chain amino acid ABC transporter permease [Labrys monachus]MDQ0395105.1 branched-subunit amino acid ABC-type transport system permease component [Labrys monachus]